MTVGCRDIENKNWRTICIQISKEEEFSLLKKLKSRKMVDFKSQGFEDRHVEQLIREYAGIQADAPERRLRRCSSAPKNQNPTIQSKSPVFHRSAQTTVTIPPVKDGDDGDNGALQRRDKSGRNLPPSQPWAILSKQLKHKCFAIARDLFDKIHHHHSPFLQV